MLASRGHGAACPIGSRSYLLISGCRYLFLQPSASECFQVLSWYQQRFSIIREGIETPSKNIYPMMSFNSCLAKGRLLRVIKVLVTLQVTTVVPLNPTVYYLFLRMTTWRCQSSAAFSLLFFSAQQSRFVNYASAFQAHLQYGVKSGMKKLEERLPCADYSGPEI